MGPKYVAFDLEITREIPAGTDDWSSLRPFGISCATTVTSDGEARTWHGALQPTGLWASQMSPADCQELVEYLALMQSVGFRIVTVNGLGFDFDVLAEECQDARSARMCQQLALEHTDIGFAMLCQKGFMVGLDAMARGLGVGGKLEGMSGALAPVMWAESRESQEKVLEYVAQDARATADVYEALLTAGYMFWTTRRGTQSRYPWRPILDGDQHILSVREALDLPEPDVSWMDDPWPRSKFYSWLNPKE